MDDVIFASNNDQELATRMTSILEVRTGVSTNLTPRRILKMAHQRAAPDRGRSLILPCLVVIVVYRHCSSVLSLFCVFFFVFSRLTGLRAISRLEIDMLIASILVVQVDKLFHVSLFPTTNLQGLSLTVRPTIRDTLLYAKKS